MKRILTVVLLLHGLITFTAYGESCENRCFVMGDWEERWWDSPVQGINLWFAKRDTDTGENIVLSKHWVGSFPENPEEPYHYYVPAEVDHRGRFVEVVCYIPNYGWSTVRSDTTVIYYSKSNIPYKYADVSQVEIDYRTWDDLPDGNDCPPPECGRHEVLWNGECIYCPSGQYQSLTGTCLGPELGRPGNCP